MEQKQNIDALENIKAMLQSMADKQNDMDEMLRDMDKTLTQLNQTVIGNPTYGQIGLVSEIKDIKDYVDKDKKLKSKLVGGLVLCGALWTFFLEYMLTFFKFKN
jgi:hypothetical protein